MPSDYAAWIEKHNNAIDKTKALIKKYGFEAIILTEERKPSFLRIRFGSRKIDFRVKVIKTNFVRSIWLCKKNRFNVNSFYILYSKKEKAFFIASGNDIDKEYELKESEWNKDVKYLVVQFAMFRPAKTFFKRMKIRYEGEIQRRINTWF